MDYGESFTLVVRHDHYLQFDASVVHTDEQEGAVVCNHRFARICQRSQDVRYSDAMLASRSGDPNLAHLFEYVLHQR